MKLTTYPESEIEYWSTIEYLGGFIWRMEHDAAHGRFVMDEATEKEISEARKISIGLVSDLFVLYGVINPKDCPRRDIEGKMPKAPPGMIWYWDWYNKMKDQFHRREYDSLICSGCALSEGYDKFLLYNQIPCSAWNGSLYHLKKPYECAMISPSHYAEWDRLKLITEIQKIGGAKAVEEFTLKEATLMRTAV